MHLEAQPVIAQYDEGGKGTCQPKEVSAKHGLADGPAFADRSNEERGCHAPYHPVGPIENRPWLWKGGGAHGIGPGCHANEILGQVADGSDACLNNIAGLAAQEQEIGQQCKEQVDAGSRQLCNAFHAKVYGHGVYHADHNQDGNGQQIAFLNTEHPA